MTSSCALSMADMLDSAKLFRPLYDGDSWTLWRACMKAMFGEDLTSAEQAKFKEVADRDPPRRRVREFECIAGRGAGKDSVISGIAAYIAASFDPRAAKLRPGELAFVLCVAVDRDQAGVVFRMIQAIFETVPAFRSMAKTIGKDSIELRNRVVIEVRTNSYRSVRGRSLLCAIFDECSFWSDERSSNPDTEMYAAVKPGLARVPQSMLLLITTAHRRAGLAYERWKKHYGSASDDVLVVRGTTFQFNPTADASLIEADMADDPARGRAEYLSEWRDDLATFISRELLEAAVDRGVTVRSPQAGVLYFSFCDMAGGGADSHTAAVAHNDKGVAVLDCIVELKGNPESAVTQIASILKTYRCFRTTADRYAADWPVTAFARHGITLRPSERDRSEIYLETLPLFGSGKVRLLDSPRLVSQYAALERRAFSTGRDRVDHPRSGADDLCNSAAGALTLATTNQTVRVPAEVLALARRRRPGRESYRFHGSLRNY